MNTMFKNFDQLTSKGNQKLRRNALEIIEAGVKKVIPYDAVKKLIQYDGKTISMNDFKISMDNVENLYVVGAGKGSFPIAQALDEIFGERIKKGFVAVKDGEKRRLKHIEVFESSHPIPDERSIIAADRIIEILKEAGANDVIFAAVTGGSSALVNKPVKGVSLGDLKKMNEVLLNSGADIGKMNAVRKHICMIKGGRLVQYGQPAMIVTLTFDTSTPDMPWPDLCRTDPSTFQDALDVMKEYDMWKDSPESVKTYLKYGSKHPELETVKCFDGMKQKLFSVADQRLSCMAAADKAKELGYEPHILSTIMAGEAKDLGIVMAGITDEIIDYRRPFKSPCALITGGETTVTIVGEHGVGGPNQETVLGFVSKIRHKNGYVFASMDTDGTDGPCDRAGGVVDGSTVQKAQELKINIDNVLRKHNSTKILETLKDDIYTGHTGTNVMNLRVVVIE
jgi:glycerate 2-kinase